MYVDGVQVATSTGVFTGDLVAPTYIGLGKNPCSATPTYTGSLDEVIVYDRELTSAEAASLYTFSASATLPLDWISFTGVVNNNKALINWEVANVVNNDHFDIEYATDAQNFIKVGTVKADNKVFKYSYPVNNLAGGNYYFRIRQVDIDGRYSFSKTIKLSVNNAASPIYLLRNPVINELVIMNPQQEIIQQVVLTDVTGRRLKAEKINASTTVVKPVIAGLKPGNYFISLTTKRGNIILPFIKQ